MGYNLYILYITKLIIIKSFVCVCEWCGDCAIHAVHLRTNVPSKCRVLKESLRSSGGNLTERHTEDLSMCALLLMEAAKKTDREYGCSQSSGHTTTDASRDIDKMMGCLMEAQVALEVSNRNTPAFEDPTEKGLHKMFNTSWIQDTLSRTVVLEDDLQAVEREDTEVNLDYELADTT